MCSYNGVHRNPTFVPDEVKQMVEDLIRDWKVGKSRSTVCIAQKKKKLKCKEHTLEQNVACKECVTASRICVRQVGTFFVLLPVCSTDRGNAAREETSYWIATGESDAASIRANEYP